MTSPAPEQPVASAASTPAPKKAISRSTDRTLSIALLSVQFVFVVIFFVLFSIGLALSVSASSLAEVAEPIMLFGPVVVFIANLIVSVVLMTKGRTAWIATLVGFIVAPLTFFLGNVLLQVGLPTYN
jgi:hypothetical protein